MSDRKQGTAVALINRLALRDGKTIREIQAELARRGLRPPPGGGVQWSYGRVQRLVAAARAEAKQEPPPERKAHRGRSEAEARQNRGNAPGWYSVARIDGVWWCVGHAGEDALDRALRVAEQLGARGADYYGVVAQSELTRHLTELRASRIHMVARVPTRKGGASE